MTAPTTSTTTATAAANRAGFTGAGTGEPATARAGFDREAPGWRAWLAEQVDPDWRADEWVPRWWLFTGDPDNPATAAQRCRTTACTILITPARGRFCRGCTVAHTESGLDPDTFAATYRPVPAQINVVRADCQVRRDGLRCVVPAFSRGLCSRHNSQWNNYRNKQHPGPRLALESWVEQIPVPFTDPPPACLVGGCAVAAMNAHGVCDYHWRLWRRDLAAAAAAPVSSASTACSADPDPVGWAAGQTPFLRAHQFSLLPLPELLRWEMLVALDRRDRIGRVLNPSTMRAIVRALGESGASTLLADDIEDAIPPAASGRRGTAAQRRGLLAELAGAARAGFDEFCGIDRAAQGLVDLRLIGVRSDYTATRRRKNGGTADLASIEQIWLRQLLAGWTSNDHPNSSAFTQTLKAVRFASQALAARPGGGHDPAALRFPDMSAAVAHIWAQRKPDGRAYSPSTPRNWVWKLFALLDYGARAGFCDELSASFVRDRNVHARPREESNEGELGKAIPEPVIAQLDAHLQRIGRPAPGVSVPGSSQLHGEDLAALYRTCYLLLRDTGRRPNEIAGLPRNCLEQRGDEVSLLWHNRKARRRRRRLPITAATAQIIRDWQVRRDQLTGLPAGSEGFLFPALSAGTRDEHFPTHSLWLGVRRWVHALPELFDEGLDPRGNRRPFDRARIYPYAFRHSYAQRHADAGTPVDVLAELMDHNSIQTTQGYYTVSLARRRAAVSTLAAQVIDRTGTPSPCSAGAYELRSVAVPYGGCTEPSNVKAGGKACPIRFQCAGCGFYRPDPSYLTAIEQHLNELRAEHETAQALGAADYVTTAMGEEITAYEAVAATMRTRLADLDDDERAEIEHASTLLRRIRAGTALPLTVIDPTNDSPDDGTDGTGNSAGALPEHGGSAQMGTPR
ncbi:MULTISPECIES: tyrosine-type recombinase/integrase [Pseudonocardia]|uniref:Site-specific tyrosine recombinase XerD n=2 Tax=Pseudonocardia TaxID=1847 RepID=A0A1Y2N9F1_PSEAH|nr:MULTISPECIES: tyrosine-type recombinase/integrase [Pseudonocardia]OSY43687.1 site-specific tyrosine recombinase XerD [Pseudonocardia autotrophica]TDN73323.1 phage integrase family protein [Pseudonocardia autotrophica]BBG04061.1 hypothetical protein Pdca_52700 [Pseudonocardia autotrophica]GEC26198.1 hypothetical protein PSA01_32270 [Pseudonocardia saturnea]